MLSWARTSDRRVKTSPRRGRHLAMVALGLSGALLSMGLPATRANAAVVADGTSEETAAASCWEIKQNNPSATDGKYWLWTPQLKAPEQFYCDQTTNGGGWVLVGRGRDSWTETNEGVGTPAQVRDVITGQSAFVPRQLSTDMIDGLLNGGRVDALADGIRLKRATNTAGTTWQDVTFKYASPRDKWSWAFNSQQRVGTWKVGALTGTGGQTQSFGSGTTLERVQTTATVTQGYRQGFGFGNDSRGTPDAASYVWAPDTASGSPRPFTQVFLRPQLSSSTAYTSIPDTGTSSIEGLAMAESTAASTVWGVTGLGAGPNTVEGSVEVSAFTESNGIVYVGGNFTAVQRNSAGLDKVAQPYLAAFNVRTGEWISTFRPTFDKQVKALAALPDGRIAVGGYFSVVNGKSAAGLVVLNPTTGATDSQFTGRIINRLTGGVPVVRTLDVQGSWLYVGGAFTHMTGGTETREVYTRSAGRMSVTNGTPNAAFNPELNGSVVSLDASSQGDRVYYAGYFTQSIGRTVNKAAAIQTADLGLVPWTVHFSDLNKNYQQTVKEIGNRVWLGGSQHMLFSYDRSNLVGGELSTNITMPGGDFQSIATDGKVLYAGCHCFNVNYEGAKSYPTVGTAWKAADKMNSDGAWDAASGARLPQWSPTLSQRDGAGSWAAFSDSTGTLWLGGDYTKSRRVTGSDQWSGGYVRFAPRDVTAPSRPSALKASVDGAGVALSWTGSSDNRAVTRYEVLRNDRVVGTTTGTTLTLKTNEPNARYFVRAADAAGNRSASTAAVTATTPTVTDQVLVANAGTWSYYFQAAAPAATWKDPGFDASSWATGQAPLGWGSTTLKTVLTAPDPKPVASYHRKTFTVTDPSAFSSVKITTRADDGIVLYLNGVEIGRANMSAGTVTNATYATVAVSTTNAVATPYVVTVPASQLTTGTNVLTAEVHSNYRTTPNTSFDLEARGLLQ